jgi:anti-anti-sigma regulatory factor
MIELLKLLVPLMLTKLTLDLSKLPFNSTVGLMEIVSMLV